MDPSAKIKPKSVPFQTITRNRSRALTSKQMTSPVVVVRKLSPSQYTKNSLKRKKIISSPKSSQEGAVENESKKYDDSALFNIPSTSKKDKDSTPKKRTKKAVSVKTMPVNKKTKITNRRKSNISHSSSDQVCKGSKNCKDCATKDETISYLQSRVKFLEVEEASVLKRQPMYEGFGFPSLVREEENHNLLIEKELSERKLNKAEAEFQRYLRKEDDEIKKLIHKKNFLKRKLSETMDLCFKEEAEGIANINKIKEKIEKCKTSEAKSASDVEELKKKLAEVGKKVAEEREKFLSRPKEKPIEEPVQKPCGICRELTEKRKSSKIMLAKVKEENQTVKQLVFDSVVKLKDNACDIAHLSYEIEYIKKRIELEYSHKKDPESLGGADFYDRKDFSIKICNMMEKNFSSRKYRPVPASVFPCRTTVFEKNLAKVGNVCCHKFESAICRRFFCGRLKDEGIMTEEERISYELSKPPEFYRYPGRIETEEGKKIYINNMVRYIFSGVSVDTIATIK